MDRQEGYKCSLPVKSIITKTDVVKHRLNMLIEEKKSRLCFSGDLKNKDGQELFIVGGKDDIEDIYNMNDHTSRNIIKSRNRQIEQSKEIKHQYLKDVQMDLHMQATQDMRQHMRNRT